MRIPVRTHVIGAGEDITAVVEQYCRELVQPGDIIFISEKAVSASEGRAIPLEEIHPNGWARFLSRHVRKVPYGIGLGIPETMQMAINEVGLPRVLAAAGVAAVTKLVGRSGDFYRIAGMKASVIDGPVPYALPPFNRCVVLCPVDPNGTSERIARRMNAGACIVDINDIGGSRVLGASRGVNTRLVERVLNDNPLGNTTEQTPIGILRKAPE
jgi:F420-0:gamma-glutamyl ligase